VSGGGVFSVRYLAWRAWFKSRVFEPRFEALTELLRDAAGRGEIPRNA
jgi:hypothetical protein